MAFAGQIPDEIVSGKNNHTSRHANQINELLFEPLEG